MPHQQYYNQQPFKVVLLIINSKLDELILLSKLLILLIDCHIIKMSNFQLMKQDKGLYLDQEWISLKSSITNIYCKQQNNNTVNDHLYIQMQTQLMQEIKNRIQRSKYIENFVGMEILPIDSSISNINSVYSYDNDESLIKSKFTQQFQSSLVNSALKEVRQNCSEQTYQTFKTYVINNKQTQCQNVGQLLQKKITQNEELSINIIIKQNELNKLRQQMNPYITKLDYFEEEKKKWKRKNDQISEKQIRIHKAEMTLIFKEKIHQQAKKKNQRMKQFSSQVQLKMLKIEADLNQIWKNILIKMENNQQIQCCLQVDLKGCWKKQVMKKCREKLLQERNLLKEQQKQLENQYEMMESISDQFKKLINDIQEGISSSQNITNSTQRQKSVIRSEIVDSCNMMNK